MTHTARPLRALLWKEIIELTRYSAPVFLLYAVFIWLDAKPPASLRQVMQPAERFVWFGLFNALVGTILGFSQTWRESRIDAWAFAVHRPVSRSRVFLAKMIAGQLTLLAVAGLPYTVAMIWTAIPGNVAVPFDRNMWQPGIADLLSGLVFHAAGMFVGARHNSIVVRSLGVLAAIFAAIMFGASQPFRYAVVEALIFGSIFLTAAWATFTSRDDSEAQSWLGRVANVFVLVPTCLVLYIVGALTWEGFTPASIPPGRGQPAPHALVTPDGEVARVTLREEVQRAGNEELYVVTATDLDGRSRPDLAAKLAVSPAGSGVLVTDQMRIDPMVFNRGYRSASRWVQRLFIFARGQIWYYERRHRVISVYDDSTRRRVGWIGPDGFSASDTMPTRRFEGDLRPGTEILMGSAHLIFTGAVYTVAYPGLPRLLFRAPDGDTIGGFSQPSFRALNRTGYASGASWSQFYAVTTNRAVYVMDPAGRVEIVSPHPTKLRRWSSATVWRAPNAPGRPTFIWYPDATDSLDRVLEYRQGIAEPVANRQFVGPMLQPEQMGSGGRMEALAMASSGGSAVRAMSSSGGAPGVMMATEVGFETAFMGLEIGSSPDGSSSRPSARAVVTFLLVAVASMAAMWLVGRRYAFTTAQLAFWLAAALVGGPFALLLFWLTTERPPRERCPACGKMRVVNRERCEHCDAPFTGPAPDGTELFAMST